MMVRRSLRYTLSRRTLVITACVLFSFVVSFAIRGDFSAPGHKAAPYHSPAPPVAHRAATPAAPMQAATTLLTLRFENGLLDGEQGETPVQSSSVTFQPGISGQGLYMDRGNRLTYSSDGNINSTEGTIELWLKPSWAGNDGLNHAIFRYGTSNGYMLLGKEGNNLRLALNRANENGSLELDASTSIENWQADQWHHVAASWSNTGQFLRLYVDGTLVSERLFTATLPTISSTTNPTFQIGGDSIRFPLLATIDDVNISEGARSSQEIATRMLTGITVTSVTLSPNVSSIEMYPGWTYWQDFKYTAVTAIGTLTLPWQVGTLTSSNTALVTIDAVTGRIKAVAPGLGTTITALFGGVQTVITVNVLTPSKAMAEETIESYLSTPATGALYNIPVAIIRYIPTTDGTNVDATAAGYTSTLGALRTKQTKVEKKLKFILEEGSRFRGYSGAAPLPSLGYRVVKIINVYEDIPPGLPTATSGVYYPDYKQIFNRHNVKDLVVNQGVKEIWLEQYVNGRIALDESNMASPVTGDVSTSSRRNDDLPVYAKGYTVFGINFAQGENNAARHRGHHLETLLTYANVLQDNDDLLFQESFIGRDIDGTFLQGRCGKTDRPPNSSSNFDYNNATGVESDIEDWFPDGSGTRKTVNNATWGNLTYTWPETPDNITESQWHIYWRQAIPGLNNAITRLESERLTNWWQFTADWDGAMQAKLGLAEALTCQYALSSTSRSVSGNGTSGSVNVTAGAGCKWFATTSESWIKLTNAAGTGNGKVNYTVDPTTVARTGTIVIAGQVFTITQSNCTFTLTPASQTVAASSGSASVSVNVTGAGSCSWTATSNANWLTVISGGTGSASGTVNFTVAANTGAARTATVTVADQTVTITQSSGCTYALVPTNRSISAAGGSDSVSVQTGTGCPWDATSNAAWLTITAGNSGTGNGTVALTVGVNNGAERTGTLTIGGQTYTVTQAAANPAPTLTSLSPNTTIVGGAAFTLTVNGTNFNNTSVVNWNGSSRTTTLVNATQLQAAITAADIATAGSASVTVTNPAPGGGTTSALSFAINNPVPTLTSINPTSVLAGSAGFTLTLNGANFVAASAAQVNGSNRTTTFVNSTSLTINITAAEIATAGTLNIVVVTPAPGGGTTAQQTLTINNPVPSLTSLGQTSATAGSAGFTLIVNGTNFVNTSKVRWKGSDRTTTFVSATQLTAAVPAADLASSGTADVTVFSPTPGGGTTSAITFTINNPAPTITSLSPNNVIAGTSAFTLTVNGTGFVANSVIRWNGSDRTTTFVSSTQLSANITAADVVSAGTANVTVFNPTPGGGASGASTFTINNPAPAITGLNPSSLLAGSTAFNLTVTGSNFVNGSTVRWNGNTRTTTFVNSTQLTAAITAADVATAGSASVTVFNSSPGGGTSSALTFTITTPCSYSVVPATQNFTASGGTGSLTVTTGASCTWTAVSNDSWITINAGNSGTGNGVVNFTVAANTGATRSGTLTVAGQTLTVTQDAQQTTCVAQRTLPAAYAPGQAVVVSIQASPAAGTQSYAVEDIPPAGWTVSGIDNGGQFDAINGKVKWGPFFDAQQRTLTYSATPPAGTTGKQTFNGAISVNGISSAICGALDIELSTFRHPADLNDNLKIEINELTSYGAAWKAGTAWSRPPNPIDINYLTNAGLIWKLGEVYHYDPSKNPPFAAGANFSILQSPGDIVPFEERRSSAVAVNWIRTNFSAVLPTLQTPGAEIMATIDEAWNAATEAFAEETVPSAEADVEVENTASNETTSVLEEAAFVASGTAVASFSGASYTPGLGTTVTIVVTPDASTQVYAVEETPPLGWVVSNISNNGTFDGTNKKVKWGPFFDNTPRTLTYVVTPPAGETGSKTFAGFASFDGGSVGITGSRTLSPPPSCTYSIAPTNQGFNASGGTGSFTMTAPSGCTWTATTSSNWITLNQSSGSGNGSVNYTVAANIGPARSGTITVNGQTFTVNQNSGCTYSNNPTSKSVAATGEQVNVSVTAGIGCSWNVINSISWVTINSGNSGSGNGTVTFTVAANDGAARASTLTIAGQTFTVNQAANAAPTITAASALTRQQGATATAVTIATVSDAETALGNLVVTTTSIPAGISVTALTNTNGTVSAVVMASCSAIPGANTVGLKVTNAQGASALANLTVNVTSSPSCFLQTTDSSGSDQRVGSVLLYSYYTSSISSPALQNTQIRITNIHETLDTAVRLYFVDGQFASVTSLFICLPPNQTASFLMSEVDPGVTGYVIAVAVSKTSGCPTNFNFLTGGALIKLSSGHTANLPAMAIAALATNPTTCTAGSSIATLNFDGINYGRLPRMLVLDSLPSLKDSNDTRLMLARVGGSLVGTAGVLGTISGKIYNSSRTAQDFNFSAGTPQFSSSFSLNFPRLTTRLDNFIPAGQNGWLRLWTDANIGIIGSVINLPGNLRMPNAFEGGYNLQQGALSAAVSLEIPISVPTCQ